VCFNFDKNVLSKCCFQLKVLWLVRKCKVTRVEFNGKIYIFVITFMDAWGMCIAMVMAHLSELHKEAVVRTIFIARKLVMVVRWKVVTFQLSRNVFLKILYLVFFIENKIPNYYNWYHCH